jgi:hypothetical protein
MAARRAPIPAAARWDGGDDKKLIELINKGKCDPWDRSVQAIKALHQHWPHRTYKAFAELIRKKLKTYCAGQLLNGARGKILCRYRLSSDQALTFHFPSSQPRRI